jgi:hypothetical protein
MKVIGLSGHVWACAWLATTATNANRAHRMTLDFTAFSSGYGTRPPSAAQLPFLAFPVRRSHGKVRATGRTVGKMLNAIH